ncbi:MAG TPA: hypothetical protein VGM86_20585 [Thermoanaerobaculia bacterium]|jgi:hypothetical protein
MKKNGVKKLRISRETLRDLERSDAWKVVGASEERMSCQSACGFTTRTGADLDPCVIVDCC